MRPGTRGCRAYPVGTQETEARMRLVRGTTVPLRQAGKAAVVPVASIVNSGRASVGRARRRLTR